MLSEELEVLADNGESLHPVTRGTLLDERLRHLIASVSTALDEYRRLAVEEIWEEPALEPEVIAASEETASGVQQSLKLEADIAAAARTVGATTKPESRTADDLKRQLSDGEGINRVALAELRNARSGDRMV